MKLKKKKLFILFKNYIFLFLTILILGFVAYKYFIFKSGTFYNLTQEKSEIETKKKMIEEEIQMVKEKKEYLKTEDGKERVKREVNLYKKPGEKVINIVDF
ncbi:hypothetical protein CSB11_01420 [Candidatus Campbellbacteria bacterium]|nr:MAG: hypothetical protein CSB11_01420 [Candidatus Campbellbacteria bacterium]